MFEMDCAAKGWPLASIHNHFNQDCHLNRRDTFKQSRVVALAESRELAA